MRLKIALAALVFHLSAVAACALSLEKLSDEEVVLLRASLKALDPMIIQRKQEKRAPLLTFEELHASLNKTQQDFLDSIRQVRPEDLTGASRRLPPPAADEEFIRLDTQVVMKEGKPILLDAQYLPRRVYEAYRRMMAAMELELGKRLLVESGYRSPAYQLYLFLFYMPKHGFSIRETNRFVALPGCSEHGSPDFQAIDFITPQGINGEEYPEEFEELQEYGWLQARAHEFGFHLSYPRPSPQPSPPRGGEGKGEGVSSAAFEPWHWHYEAMKN